MPTKRQVVGLVLADLRQRISSFDVAAEVYVHPDAFAELADDYFQGAYAGGGYRFGVGGYSPDYGTVSIVCAAEGSDPYWGLVKLGAAANTLTYSAAFPWVSDAAHRATALHEGDFSLVWLLHQQGLIDARNIVEKLTTPTAHSPEMSGPMFARLMRRKRNGEPPPVPASDNEAEDYARLVETASGEGLDAVGAVFGRPRKESSPHEDRETDADYRKRLQDRGFLPGMIRPLEQPRGRDLAYELRKGPLTPEWYGGVKIPFVTGIDFSTRGTLDFTVVPPRAKDFIVIDDPYKTTKEDFLALLTPVAKIGADYSLKIAKAVPEGKTLAEVFASEHGGDSDHCADGDDHPDGEPENR